MNQWQAFRSFCKSRVEQQVVGSLQKLAGEFIATKQNTHRPSPTRAVGLRARDKGFLIILQTEEENKFGGMNYV